VVGITPALAASTPPAPGEPVTVVGFGCLKEGHSYENTFGTKRKAENTVSEVTATELGYPIGSSLGSLCEGDSGGPSFALQGGNEVLVGVHSYDSGALSYDQRVDAFLGWVEQQSQGDLYQGPPKDQTPPTVQITSPADGARIGSHFTVEVSARDDVALARVELRLDASLRAQISASPYRFDVELPLGPHAIQADAVDTSDHRASAAIHVEVTPEETHPDGAALATDGGSPRSAGGGSDGGGCSCAMALPCRRPLPWPMLILLAWPVWRRSRTFRIPNRPTRMID
jgi:hypothetical protein